MKPLARIEVIGSRTSLHLSAIIDTGFDGDLSVPTDIAIALGLELRTKRKYTLADGSVHSELAFAGKVRFLGEDREIEILLTDLDVPLIGTALLEDCRLTVDFANETVELKKAKRKAPRR
jgi:clan AA aspartic protease